ncbi:hypothetical protein ACJX0J_036121, partial [Zea mays]
AGQHIMQKHCAKNWPIPLWMEEDSAVVCCTSDDLCGQGHCHIAQGFSLAYHIMAGTIFQIRLIIIRITYIAILEQRSSTLYLGGPLNIGL